MVTFIFQESLFKKGLTYTQLTPLSKQMNMLSIVISYVQNMMESSKLLMKNSIISLFFSEKKEEQIEENQLTKTDSSQISADVFTEEDYALIKQLIVQMEQNQVFLNNKLSLISLSELIGSNRHKVSRLINLHFHKNYNDFVNEYRVNYLKKSLLKQENSSYTLLYLAIEAGFNNKVSFNKAFKKFTGMTPSEYVKSKKGKK